VTRPEDGSQPSQAAKISCSTSPNQNAGSASPTADAARMLRSSHRPRASAAMVPKVTVSIAARSIDAAVSSIVAGARSRTRVSTGRLSVML
jgi:hypothetical protein